MITYQQNTQQLLQEHSAVNRLLEMAERRDPTEDTWNEKERLRLLGSLLGKRVGGIERQSRQSRSLQKKHQRERLHDLSDQSNPEPQYSRNRYNEDHLRLSMELSKNIRIRPINSNLTFYSPDKQKPTSLTFYRNHSRLDQPALPIKPTGNQLRSFNSIASNRVVYFKSNKAETVRQLLKEMKHQRGNHNQIMLHSTSNGKGPKNEEQSFPQFQDVQVAFGGQREDQIVVIGQGSHGRREENIWKKKLRAARSRRISQLENKHSTSKKLILRD